MIKMERVAVISDREINLKSIFQIIFRIPKNLARIHMTHLARGVVLTSRIYRMLLNIVHCILEIIILKNLWINKMA